MRNLVTLLSISLTLSVLSSAGHSAPIFELTGTHDSVNPGTAHMFGGDASLAYFNPALLPDAEDGLSLSLFFLGQDLDISLAERPAGVDIGSSIYDARLLNPDGTTSRLSYRPLATADLVRARGSAQSDAQGLYLGLGTVVQLVERRLALGLQATMPAGDFQAQQSFFADEREQFFSNSLHFELLGDRLRASALALGLGWRPLDWLAIGSGVTMSTSSRVKSHVYVGDASYQETAEINTEMEVDMRFVPHASVAIDPLRGLRISSSVHLPYESKVEGASEVQMWNYPYEEGQDSLEQVFAFSHGYEPLRVALGAAWQFDSGPIAWGLAAQTQWTRWSAYKDRHGERPGLEWNDTFSGTVGGRADWGGNSIGLDLSFVPSPVPHQKGRSNYVDNHRGSLAGGYERSFRLGGRTFSVGLQVQASYLVPREVDKDLSSSDPVFDEFPDSVDVMSGLALAESEGLQTNNPGYPGFSSRGWILGGGLWLKSSLVPAQERE